MKQRILLTLFICISLSVFSQSKTAVIESLLQHLCTENTEKQAKNFVAPSQKKTWAIHEDSVYINSYSFIKKYRIASVDQEKNTVTAYCYNEDKSKKLRYVFEIFEENGKWYPRSAQPSKYGYVNLWSSSTFLKPDPTDYLPERGNTKKELVQVFMNEEVSAGATGSNQRLSNSASYFVAPSFFHEKQINANNTNLFCSTKIKSYEITSEHDNVIHVKTKNKFGVEEQRIYHLKQENGLWYFVPKNVSTISNNPEIYLNHNY